MLDLDPATVLDVTIAAVVLPPFIALLNRTYWSAPMKGLLALAVCMVYALVAEWVRGTLNVGNWRDAVLIVCATAFGFYRIWWQPSQIAPSIEAATTPGRPAPVV